MRFSPEQLASLDRSLEGEIPPKPRVSREAIVACIRAQNVAMQDMMRVRFGAVALSLLPGRGHTPSR